MGRRDRGAERRGADLVLSLMKKAQGRRAGAECGSGLGTQSCGGAAHREEAAHRDEEAARREEAAPEEREEDEDNREADVVANATGRRDVSLWPRCLGKMRGVDEGEDSPL